MVGIEGEARAAGQGSAREVKSINEGGYGV